MLSRRQHHPFTLLAVCSFLLGCSSEDVTVSPPTCHLGIDHGVIQPSDSLVEFSAENQNSITFSVAGAIEQTHCENAAVNTYWYVNFHFDAPQSYEHLGESFVLERCHKALLKSPKKTVLIEALSSTGPILEQSTASGADPRYSPENKPIVKSTWAVSISLNENDDCVTSRL